MKNKFVKIIEGKVYNFDKVGRDGITYKVTYGKNPHDNIELKKDSAGVWKVQPKTDMPAYIDRIALELHNAIEDSINDE